MDTKVLKAEIEEGSAAQMIQETLKSQLEEIAELKKENLKLKKLLDGYLRNQQSLERAFNRATKD